MWIIYIWDPLKYSFPAMGTPQTILSLHRGTSPDQNTSDSSMWPWIQVATRTRDKRLQSRGRLQTQKDNSSSCCTTVSRLKLPAMLNRAKRLAEARNVASGKKPIRRPTSADFSLRESPLSRVLSFQVGRGQAVSSMQAVAKAAVTEAGSRNVSKRPFAAQGPM